MKKMFFDFFPVLLFFLVFKFYPDFTVADSQVCLASLCIPGGAKGAIYAATAAAIVASALQLGWSWQRHGKVETMHWVTLVLLVVLGGATLVLQNETFIKWKPTAVNWLFGAVFLGSHFIGRKPIIQRMMEKSVQLTDERVWARLSLLWVAFFIGVGFVNLYVAFNFSTEAWVNFKLFGMIGLTIVFIIVQAFYIARYIDEDAADAEKAAEGND